MPQFPRSQGIILTVGFYGGGERFQCVLPYLYTVAYDPNTVGADFGSWMGLTVIPAWVACLAVDMELVGWQIEPMSGAGFVPSRVVYSAGTFPGTVAGESYSQNVSMLIAFRSASQSGSGARIRTGKAFIGPPPESKSANRTLLAAFVTGELTTLAVALRDGQVGATSGLQFVKALSNDPTLVGGSYQADIYDIRGNVATQRRRLTPII